MSATRTLESSPKHGSPPGFPSSCPPSESQWRGHPHLEAFHDSTPPFSSSGPGALVLTAMWALRNPLQCLLVNSFVSPNRGLVLLISMPTAPSAVLGTRQVLSDFCSNTQWNELRHLPCSALSRYDVPTVDRELLEGRMFPASPPAIRHRHRPCHTAGAP